MLTLNLLALCCFWSSFVCPTAYCSRTLSYCLASPSVSRPLNRPTDCIRVFWRWVALMPACMWVPNANNGKHFCLKCTSFVSLCLFFTRRRHNTGSAVCRICHRIDFTWCVSQVYSSNVFVSSGPAVASSEVLCLLAYEPKGSSKSDATFQRRNTASTVANVLTPLCCFTFHGKEQADCTKRAARLGRQALPRVCHYFFSIKQIAVS